MLSYIRNLTDSPIILSISSNTGESLGLEGNIVLWKDSIIEINHDNNISFSDTLIWESVNKTKYCLVIPSNSTALIQLPSGWRMDQYLVSVEYRNGVTDSLLKNSQYKVVRKDGEIAKEPRVFSNDLIFVDIR